MCALIATPQRWVGAAAYGPGWVYGLWAEVFLTSTHASMGVAAGSMGETAVEGAGAALPAAPAACIAPALEMPITVAFVIGNAVQHPDVHAGFMCCAPQVAMLRLNLREARDILARRLAEVGEGLWGPPVAATRLYEWGARLGGGAATVPAGRAGWYCREGGRREKSAWTKRVGVRS